MKPFIYLDNAATTKPSAIALQKANALNTKCYANPSSPHRFGLLAEQAVEAARADILKLCAFGQGGVIFTSGGTEANNLAIFGVCRHSSRKPPIVSNKAEHPSVSAAYAQLEKEGYPVTMLPLDENGHINVATLEASITPETKLVSIMHVNNETGVIQDIAAIGRVIKERNNRCLFHVDGVQGFGKHPLDMRHVDLYTTSAHKIHGLKGAGALAFRPGVSLSPMIAGGDQQKGLRPGTENPAGVAAFAEVAKLTFAELDKNMKTVSALKQQFLEGLECLADVRVNSSGSPYIANVSFLDVRGEVLVNALSDRGIYAGTGASCHAKSGTKNVLGHYGLSKDVSESAVRFSFSPENTSAEIRFALGAIAELLPYLRKAAR